MIGNKLKTTFSWKLFGSSMCHLDLYLYDNERISFQELYCPVSQLEVAWRQVFEKDSFYFPISFNLKMEGVMTGQDKCKAVLNQIEI